jgi:hypothetical protein
MSLLLVAGLIQGVAAAARGAASEINELSAKVSEVQAGMAEIVAGMTSEPVSGDRGTGLVTVDELRVALDELRREFRK